MNEITAAIAKKAFERYGSSSNHAAMSYIAGGEDAIGFMLKFVEWVEDGYLSSKEHGGLWWSYNDWPHKKASDSFTTEQLLLKYMEDNKL